MFGYFKDKIDNLLFFIIFFKVQFNGDDIGIVLVDVCNIVVEIGYVQCLQFMFYYIDGSEFFGEVIVVFNLYQEEMVYLIFCDYLKLVRQQKVLVEFECCYCEFIDFVLVGICKVDVYGRIELNFVIVDEMLGYDWGENLGVVIFDFVYLDDW